jgi:L-alanine-DL-glutamate epimerase-like enolase superfamily enzyme
LFLSLHDKALRGRDAENFALAHRVMEQTVGGGMPGSRGARSAVDMALYDLVYQAAAACKEYVGKGFRGLKVKVGGVLLAEGWHRVRIESELAKLRAALDVVPRDV